MNLKAYGDFIFLNLVQFINKRSLKLHRGSGLLKAKMSLNISISILISREVVQKFERGSA